MENSVFFSENGITSTSANHICNVAKEYLQTKKNQLNALSFINTSVSIIGSEASNQIEIGNDNIDWVEDTLNDVANVNSLVAWLREAIKEKERQRDIADNYTFRSYLSEKEIELEEPEREIALTESAYYNALPIKQRNRYYQLSTYAAVIGKFIHPDGEFSRAKTKANERMNKPTEIDKNGRDTLIYHYDLSMPIDKINEVYFALQNKHREIQAQLNQMKHECEQAIMDSEFQIDKKYQIEYEEYSEKKNKLRNEWKLKYDQMHQEVKALKIAIPDSLKATFEMLSKLGKDKK